MLYQVTYTISKYVIVEAKSEEEASTIANNLEDYNYEFLEDSFEVQVLQKKTISTAIVFKEQGLQTFSKKIVDALPKKEAAFENIEEIKFKQIEDRFIEIEISSFNLSDLEIIELIQNICNNKFKVN